jgi:hypothetical protein
MQFAAVPPSDVDIATEPGENILCSIIARLGTTAGPFRCLAVPWCFKPIVPAFQTQAPVVSCLLIEESDNE